MPSSPPPLIRIVVDTRVNSGEASNSWPSSSYASTSSGRSASLVEGAQRGTFSCRGGSRPSSRPRGRWPPSSAARPLRPFVASSCSPTCTRAPRTGATTPPLGAVARNTTRSPRRFARSLIFGRVSALCGGAVSSRTITSPPMHAHVRGPVGPDGHGRVVVVEAAAPRPSGASRPSRRCGSRARSGTTGRWRRPPRVLRVHVDEAVAQRQLRHERRRDLVRVPDLATAHAVGIDVHTLDAAARCARPARSRSDRCSRGCSRRRSSARRRSVSCPSNRRPPRRPAVGRSRGRRRACRPRRSSGPRCR